MLKAHIGGTSRRSAHSLRSASIILVTFAIHVVAAAEDEVVPSVTVTAQRIQTVEDKTPISLHVITQSEIQTKGIYQLNDLVGVVAGVAVPNGYSNMPQAVGIRGVGVSQPAMTQAVGIYLDDVPLLRGYATALWDLPDVVRYEVLRGPQGTLYGQNSTAGAIKLVSLDPDQIDGSWVNVGVGNYGQREVRGLFAARLDDKTSASLALSRRINDGFAYNAAKDERINKLDATQFRGKLKIAWSPALRLVLAADGLLDRSDTNTINFPLNHAGATPRVSYTTADAGAFKRVAGGQSATLEWDLTSTAKLRSITAYRGYTDDPTVADWGGLEVQRYALSQRVTQRTFSQELQFSQKEQSWNLVSGLIVTHDRFTFDRDVTSFPLASPSPKYTNADTLQNTNDIGAYAQGHVQLSDQVGATVGVRAYHTRQAASNAFFRTDAQFVPTAQVYDAASLRTSASGILPRLGVDYGWSPDVFTYASIAKGEKFAGFNRAAESLISAGVAARPEKVTTYEVGLKKTGGVSRPRVSIAAFYNDYQDYLASLNNSVVNGVLVTDAVFTNAAKARTMGVDLDAELPISARLSATMSAEWLESEFLNFANPTGAASSDFSGHELPYAPHLSSGLGLRSRFNDMGGHFTGDVWFQYIDRQYVDAANTSALRVPTQTYVNFSLAYSPDHGPWSLEFRVRNATNRTYALARNVIQPLGINTAYYNAPRTVMLNVRYEL